MTRAERDELRRSIAWMKPGMSVEVKVGRLRELLDDLLVADVNIKVLSQHRCARCRAEET